jgi:hypothetical protein
MQYSSVVYSKFQDYSFLHEECPMTGVMWVFTRKSAHMRDVECALSGYSDGRVGFGK